MKKNIAIICFTERGLHTSQLIRKNLFHATVWCKKKNMMLPDAVFAVDDPLTDWTGARFADSDLLIFVGATGIAVRAIAPHLRSKKTDPAVLCVDEAGTYVISLVSGHIGGANREAALLAERLGAIPVITTATDINGRFAVDVFARENGLAISDMKLAKYISAAILDGEKIVLRCAGEITGKVPEELVLEESLLEGSLPEESEPDEPESGEMLLRESDSVKEPGDGAFQIMIDCRRDSTEVANYIALSKISGPAQTLYLIPKAVTVGLGCRRDKAPVEMTAFVERVLAEEGIFPEAIEQVATIDIKKDEAAMAAVAEKYGVPLVTFDAQALRDCPGEYSASAFVKDNVGVDNVCERSAVLASGGRLLRRKTAENGMTMALAVREWRVHFA